MMDHVHLGRTALRVSRLCLGTMNFGPRTTEEDSHAILDAAREAGMNFFDTANVYGRPVGVGVTEQIVGRWFARGGGRREDTVLATKVYGQMGGRPEREAPVRPAHPPGLRGQPAPPPDRLHRPLPDAPHLPRGALGRGLAGHGSPRAAGQGPLRRLVATSPDGTSPGLETAEGAHFLGLVSEQSLYHLLERTAELEVLPACETTGSRSFRGARWPAACWAARRRRRRETEGCERRSGQSTASAWRPGRRSAGSSARRPPDVALAWLLHQHGVTAPDHRPPHDGAARGRAPRAGDRTVRRAPRAPRRDLPRPRRPGTPEAYAW